MKHKKTNIVNILGGDMLKSSFVRRQVPLALIIIACCIVMVRIRYRVEDLMKEKLALEEEIDFLHEQRVQKQKQYQELIRLSRLDMVLDTIDVGVVAAPPYELQAE